VNRKPSTADVMMQLAANIIVPVTEKQWLSMEAEFPKVDTIETGMSGQIHLVRRPVEGKKVAGWAFVEQPKAGQRVIRPFKNEKEARALIADRLAAYERMWDG
jgi:putative heme iron utilization protein